MASRGGKRKGIDNGFDDWGGYMAAKISKLENQFLNEVNADATNKVSNIFANIAIYVNGYTTPTAEELKRIMLANGGIYHHYYNPRTTTHIIASNLCGAKLKKLKGDEKIVKPEWIVDSLKANTLLDCKPYTLHAEALEKGQQKMSAFTMKSSSTLQTLEESNSSHCVRNSNEIKETMCSAINSPSSKEDSIHVESHASKSPSKNRDMKRAGEDDFLSEFYKRSRLHHISTLGAHFKRYVTELRDNSPGSFNGLEEIEKWKTDQSIVSKSQTDQPVFMHIDMDCFFVSVGLRNHPEFRGFPVVVTHAKTEAKPQSREGTNRELEFDSYRERWLKRSKFNSSESNEPSPDVSEVFHRLQDLDESCSMSEIASCSYEARAAGIYNGMFMGAAKKLCPSLIAIPYDFEGYKEVSTILYDTVATYTLDLEAVSCDELYADISSVLQRSELTPLEFSTHLRTIIKNKTGCNASVGMGPNMLMARLATKRAKPNGAFYIGKEDVEEFLKGHKVEDLPGIGRSIAHRLHAMNVQTCADMRLVTLGKLQHEFGNKQGQTLYNLCRGEDKRTLSAGHVRKSVSADVNYGIRFTNEQEMYKFTHELSMEVSRRMDEIHVKGQLLTLKLKIRAKGAPVESAKFMGHGVCDSISRSVTLPVATRDPDIIHKEVLSLLRQLKVDYAELRGVGIQLSKLLVDNAKSRQPAQNSLLNFIARGKATPQANFACDKKETGKAEELTINPVFHENQQLPQKLSTKGKQWKTTSVSETDDCSTTDASKVCQSPPSEASSESSNERTADNYMIDLPSVSQLDSSVLNQLPDDIRRDIVQHYEKRGVCLEELHASKKESVNEGKERAPSVHEEKCLEILPGPSNFNASNLDNQNAKTYLDVPTSSSTSACYEGIKRICDIDASFWSAMPDDIKAELAQELEQTKPDQEPASPSKCWKNLLKPAKSPLKQGKLQKSPKKAALKQGVKRKTKPVQSKIKVQQPTLANLQSKPLKEVSRADCSKAVNGTTNEISLSGATTLPEIRQLLIEWFSSTEEPENEDRDAVSNFLVSLVNNQDLHRVEPIIKFLQRWSENKNRNWKRVINEIINHTQLHVIQSYNAPLKLT